MCHPNYLAQLSRRRFITASVAGAGAACLTSASQASDKSASLSHIQFQNIVDLTHTLTPEFPTFSGQPQFEMESLADVVFEGKTVREMGFTMHNWMINEHTGTHLDAPIHYFDPATGPEGQITAEKVSVADLVGPLAVIDIRQKVQKSPDVFVTVEDIKSWEAQHGPLPEGGIVVMNSGWDAHAHSEQFRNTDDEGLMHFPGFHEDAARFLLEEREIKGIMTDTLSLDAGVNSRTFPVHDAWLPANRWGVECVANLSSVPANGATVVVGGPKVKGASGGPCRIMAFV